MESKSKVTRIVLTAMMMCLITVSILFIRMPIPFTQGYVHLGDAMIFLSVLILGWKYGAVAAVGIPWNIGQFVVGMVFAVILSEALCRTSAKSFFTYRLKAE